MKAPLHRSRLARSLALSAALCATAGLAIGSASQPVIAAGDAQVTITKVDTTKFPTVNIEVGVPGGLVGTLTEANVQVTENGVAVPFTLQQVPANRLEVVLLLDTSGSMKEGDAIGAAKVAAQDFLAALPLEVSVGVVSFDDAPKLVSGLTTDRAALVNAINGLVADGETSLYDGIVLARSVLSGTTTDRQFVLLSDGGDTVSRNTLEAALGVTAGIRTSVIELTSSEANRDALLQIAASGNGSLSSASDPAGLSDLYVEVANALVNRYRLVVTSTSTGPATYSVQITDDGTTLSAETAVTLPDVVPTTSTDHRRNQHHGRKRWKWHHLVEHRYLRPRLYATADHRCLRTVRCSRGAVPDALQPREGACRNADDRHAAAHAHRS